jgi:hypothetical protein
VSAALVLDEPRAGQRAGQLTQTGWDRRSVEPAGHDEHRHRQPLEGREAISGQPGGQQGAVELAAVAHVARGVDAVDARRHRRIAEYRLQVEAPAVGTGEGVAGPQLDIAFVPLRPVRPDRIAAGALVCLGQ